MIIPQCLQLGDVVGLTAPASPASLETIHLAVKGLEKLGVKVVVGETCYQAESNYISASPQKRAAELMAMFTNKKIKAIFCLRGGYGTVHILPFLNYLVIRQNPKWLVGYSDITALHIAIQQNSGLASIHGAMPATELIDTDSFTFQSLQDTLFSHKSMEITNPKGERIYTLSHGQTSGPIIGGNLAVITSLLGTPYEIQTKKKLLFIEEIAEPIYKIDRMLTQLAMTGKLYDAKAIILGSFTNCEEKQEKLQLEKTIRTIIAPYQKPCIYNVRAGHCKPTISFRLGQVVHFKTNGIQDGYIQFANCNDNDGMTN